MADVQVRGCCCGIPFGCGTLAVLAALGTLAGTLIPDTASEIALTGALLTFGKLAAIFGLL